jgi:DNA-binding transcriptional LysR family regulator
MPLHIETNEIRVFKAVYEENGFKKAADKLFVTQSAISQTISNLEKKLDTLLLERNPLKLTETGIRLLNYAESVLSEEDTLLADIKNINHGILSTLLLAMSGTVNSLFGPALVATYCEQSPLTRVKLNVMPSRQIISAITSDLFELGFGPFQKSMPDHFQTIPLFRDERVLMISRQHTMYPLILADGEHKLREVPLIVSHLDDPDLRPAIDKLRDNFGTIWEVSDLALRMNLVARGLGMTYLDRNLASANSQCADFEALEFVSFAKIPLTFGLYHRRKKQLSMGASHFIDVCRIFDFENFTAE